MIDLLETGGVPDGKTSVATGLFDGIHTGHRAVIGKMLSLCGKGVSPSVFTFSEGTLVTKNGGVILPDERKKEMLAGMGVEYIYSPPFDSVKDMPPERFVKEILKERLNAESIVCGRNFRFGKGASADCDDLVRLCSAEGIKVYIVELCEYEGEAVSSSRIRKALESGNISDANRMLGREYSVSGKVIDGNKLGRILNFPTINQRIPEGGVKLRRGVYSSSVAIDGVDYDSITNIGIRPTVCEEGELLAETHILGFAKDIYGKNVEVRLREFVRDEIRFSSKDELRKQLESDILAVKNEEKR